MQPAGDDVLALYGQSQPIAQGIARNAYLSDQVAQAQAEAYVLPLRLSAAA